MAGLVYQQVCAGLTYVCEVSQVFSAVLKFRTFKTLANTIRKVPVTIRYNGFTQFWLVGLEYVMSVVIGHYAFFAYICIYHRWILVREDVGSKRENTIRVFDSSNNRYS